MQTSTHAADVALWYERYAPSLRSVAARVTGDPDDADDALHDTFLAAWRFRGTFDDARSPLPWLAVIARRKALTIVARRGAAPPSVASRIARGRRRVEAHLAATTPLHARSKAPWSISF
ncbi:MAG: hypothetical protein JWM87_3515 [Candidatus Eremiobacteraeota bacterium]|nr:hypothetical protein [Candidatus Eremiobacteraeota bacterium]